jgi:hypothetical protein
MKTALYYVIFLATCVNAYAQTSKTTYQKVIRKSESSSQKHDFSTSQQEEAQRKNWIKEHNMHFLLATGIIIIAVYAFDAYWKKSKTVAG